jgi:hypothetical protein
MWKDADADLPAVRVARAEVCRVAVRESGDCPHFGVFVPKRDAVVTGVAVIRFNTTPLDLANYLGQHMDANDRLLVSEMPDNYAFMNLMNRSKAA